MEEGGPLTQAAPAPLLSLQDWPTPPLWVGKEPPGRLKNHADWGGLVAPRAALPAPLLQGGVPQLGCVQRRTASCHGAVLYLWLTEAASGWGILLLPHLPGSLVS